MNEINLLHLGDIHFEYIDNDETSVDMKDLLFPKSLNKLLPEKSFQSMIKTLMKEIQKSPSAIMMSGDLSTYGLIESYKKCLAFLKERIPNDFFNDASFQRLFIVPGNHDVARENFSETSLFPKFEPIIEALKEKDFPVIPFPKVNIKELKDASSGTIKIITINSCLGCGERRYYPEKIRDTISNLLKSNKEDKDNLRELCFENLDTPIITEEDIEIIFQSIESVNEKCLPIILTHHNLLPQKRPRIAMYTELINSGYIREKLLMLNRPILYLHGHIHDDPVEIIQSTKYKSSRIICISAPLLFPNKIFNSSKCGFNKIKIIFDHEGLPIGCELTHYRIIEGIETKSKEKIKFWDPSDTIAYATPIERAILNSINKNIIYFGELKNNFLSCNDENLSVEQIEKYLVRLNWLGLVGYDEEENKSTPQLSRIVRKVVP